jgi:hypothetical protein
MALSPPRIARAAAYHRRAETEGSEYVATADLSNPILNSPYVAPEQHFELGPSGPGEVAEVPGAPIPGGDLLAGVIGIGA